MVTGGDGFRRAPGWAADVTEGYLVSDDFLRTVTR